MINNAASSIVLFDGVCNLCNGAVQFIMKRDRKQVFKFASLQGKTGQAYLQQQQLPTDSFHSFILIEGDALYTRSSAALRIARHLSGGWPLLYGFIILPKFIRDAVYNIIARNRYKWFGKKEQCRIPTVEERGRFLED